MTNASPLGHPNLFFPPGASVLMIVNLAGIKFSGKSTASRQKNSLSKPHKVGKMAGIIALLLSMKATANKVWVRQAVLSIPAWVVMKSGRSRVYKQTFLHREQILFSQLVLSTMLRCCLAQSAQRFPSGKAPLLSPQGGLLSCQLREGSSPLTWGKVSLL